MNLRLNKNKFFKSYFFAIIIGLLFKFIIYPILFCNPICPLVLIHCPGITSFYSCCPSSCTSNVGFIFQVVLTFLIPFVLVYLFYSFKEK